MSTINAQNYGDGTDSVPASAVLEGTAKAWVNFNGTGTIATRDSYNVTSLTDNATANYTVTLTSSMSDADYAVTTSSSSAIGNNNQWAVSICVNGADNTSSSAEFYIVSAPDLPYIYGSWLGDLA